MLPSFQKTKKDLELPRIGVKEGNLYLLFLLELNPACSNGHSGIGLLSHTIQCNEESLCLQDHLPRLIKCYCRLSIVNPNPLDSNHGCGSDCLADFATEMRISIFAGTFASAQKAK
jgi:hypothetical protein